MASNGDFVLLKDGHAILFVSDWESVRDRLHREYGKAPSAEYLITQVMGTVAKPPPPKVNSIYANYNE